MPTYQVTALLRAILLTDLEELEALAAAEAEAAAARLSGEALWAALAVAATKVVNVAAIERRAEEHGLKHGEWDKCCRYLMALARSHTDGVGGTVVRCTCR